MAVPRELLHVTQKFLVGLMFVLLQEPEFYAALVTIREPVYVRWCLEDAPVWAWCELADGAPRIVAVFHPV